MPKLWLSARLSAQSAEAPSADGPDGDLLSAVSRRKPRRRGGALDGEGFSLGALDEAAIVATTDTAGTILYVNDRFCQISGYDRTELLGNNHRLLRSGTHDRRFFRDMYRTIGRGQTWRGELCNRAKDGSLYWVDTTIVPRRNAAGKIDRYDAVRFDITPLKRAEHLLWQAAHRDGLTGLANRTLFNATLGRWIEQSSSRNRFALIILDLDGFKDVNDSFGHEAGDLLLKVVAERLQLRASARSVVARLGGDEFTMLVPLGTRSHAVAAMLDKLVAELRIPVLLPGIPRRITASIGVAIFPRDGTTGGELIRNADIALYRAKAAGRDTVRVFEPEMADTIMQTMGIRREAEEALRTGAFELFYQPIFAMGPGPRHLRGFEALLRWHHPALGLITPARFEQVFTDPGLAAEIGAFVRDAAIAQAAAWTAEGLPFNRIGINVTASDFRTDDGARRLVESIRAAGLPPSCIAIEVTEGMSIGQGQTRIHAALTELHQAGMEIVLDDFGTGFASLTHLQQLPLSRLKIDRSFVADMETKPGNAAIIAGVVQIAHSLGLMVTAEGVENEDQLRTLQRLGCDSAQGYLLGRPMPASRAPHLFASLADSLRKAV